MMMIMMTNAQAALLAAAQISTGNGGSAMAHVEARAAQLLSWLERQAPAPAPDPAPDEQRETQLDALVIPADGSPRQELNADRRPDSYGYFDDRHGRRRVGFAR